MSGVTAMRPASRPTLFALSLGHGCADLCSGGLFGLLPFLVAERHYSLAAAGVFAFIASAASAVFQPLVGAQGDRREARWLLSAGLIVTGLGMGAVGFATSYPLTLLAVAVCSAGAAAYHPEGARWARHASSSRVTADMGVFSVGGGIGYALGPLVVAAALAPLGLHGTLVVALLPFAAAAVVVVAVRRFRRQPQSTRGLHLQAGATVSEWRPFIRLVVLYCVAAGVTTGLLVYLPLFLVHARGTKPATANIMTSVLLGAAAVGTLLGGLTAQRLGAGLHRLYRRDTALLQCGLRAARAAARAGAGDRAPAQPELRGHDPPGGAHRRRHERQREHRARAGPGVPAEAHGTGYGPDDRPV